MEEILDTSIVLLEKLEEALEGNPTYLDIYHEALDQLYALDLLLKGKLPTNEEMKLKGVELE